MKVIVFFIFFISLDVVAQSDTTLVKIEKELYVLLRQLRSAATDVEREMYNISFYEELKEALKDPNILEYPFSKLTTISTIKSPDGSFRLFNWNVETNRLSHKHYCFMVKRGRVFGKNTIIEFKEDKISIPPSPITTLTPNRWYGALYYKIIPVKKGNKTLYTVLGYNGNTRVSNKKILDVFWFKGNRLRIGYPIFEENENSAKLKRRIFFEYSEKASVSIRYISGIDKIVFDHLTPETANLKGMYEFYIPDLTYDAYLWKNGVWRYQKDIQVGNAVARTTKRYYVDPETGEDKYKVEKNKWLNPDGSGEQQVVVEIENDGKKPKSTKKQKKSDKSKAKKIKSNPRSAVKIK